MFSKKRVFRDKSSHLTLLSSHLPLLIVKKAEKSFVLFSNHRTNNKKLICFAKYWWLDISDYFGWSLCRILFWHFIPCRKVSRKIKETFATNHGETLIRTQEQCHKFFAIVKIYWPINSIKLFVEHGKILLCSENDKINHTSRRKTQISC